MGSAAAMHSITTLSPATTVVFSGAAMMVTSPPAGWEPNAKNKKKGLFFTGEVCRDAQHTRPRRAPVVSHVLSRA